MPELKKLNDDSVIDFGIHKGKKLANVPSGWLLWYYDLPGNYKRPQLMEYIKENMMVLMQENDLKKLNIK